MEKAKTIDFIVNWLNAYCEQSKMKGFVVGISGGIDSALTSTLCAKTGKPTLCLNMPIKQHQAELDRGLEHIDWLKKNFTQVEDASVELTGTFEKLCQTLPKDIQDPLTMANTRARLRMLTLYGFAGHHRLLVAGTGNKVEDFGIGFFTKYGDGGVDVSPIADLTKTQVWDLAKELGLSESIIKAKPTDGLWEEERTDEDQIGASYPELEWAMDYLELNPGTDLDNLPSSLNERQGKVLHIYSKFNRANQHKMQPIPVCLIPKN